MATSISGAMRIDELHSLRRTTYTTPTRLPIGPQPVKASHSLLPVLLPDKPTVSSILGSNKPRVMLGTAIRQRLSLGSTEGGENKRPDGSRRSLGDGLPLDEAKPADCAPQSHVQPSETAVQCSASECNLEVVVTELQPRALSPDGPRFTLKRRLGTPETRAPDSPVCKRPLVADERDDLLDDDYNVRIRQRISTNPNCRRSLPGDSPARPASPQPLRPLEHSRSGSMQLLAAYASPTVSPAGSGSGRLQKTPRSDKHGHLITLSTSRLRESAKRKLQSLFKNPHRETNKENDVTHDILASIKAKKVHARCNSQGVTAAPRRVVVCDVLANYPDGVRKIRFNRVTAESELGFHVVKHSPILPLVVTRIEPFCQIPSRLLAVGDEILEINRLNCAASNMSEIIALVRSSAELVLKIKSPSRFTENRTFAL